MASNSTSTSFAPAGETAFDLWIEKSYLDGYALGAASYGVMLTLTWQTLYAFLSMPKAKTPWCLVLYTITLFILATIGFGSATKINEQSFIEDRDAPGGPAGWQALSFPSAVNMMGVIAYVILSWLADGLVVCHFQNPVESYTGTDPNCEISDASVGSMAASIALIVTSFRLVDSFWAALSVKFGTVYWSLSIALNILLTLLIAGRILFIRHWIKHSFGVNHSEHYFSAVAMLVESVSLYAAFGLVFIITYARASPVQNLIFSPLGQVQGIAPLLILSRVAQGQAWSQNTLHGTSAIHVTSPSSHAAAGSTTQIPLGSIRNQHSMVNIKTEIATSDQGKETSGWRQNKIDQV
uniref:Uncharacterized protein n=1 Tax=Mycena chlorophos TaxID=658473 RepID=A0ABQ0L4B0_MYCCL|nr:predicted protein [Mycena chlorophos]